MSTWGSVVLRSVSQSLRSLSATFPCSVQLLRRFFTDSSASDGSSRLIRLNDFSMDNMDADMFVIIWNKFFNTFGISSSLSRSPWSSNKPFHLRQKAGFHPNPSFSPCFKISTDTRKLRGHLNPRSACAYLT